MDAPTYDIVGLAERLRAVATALELRGSAEFELMWWNDRFHVIEVNPRVSGMTNLSIAISGINTYTALALGGPADPVGNPTFVAEVPLIAMDEGRRSELEKRPGVLSVAAVRYHDGTEQWKMLYTARGARDSLDPLGAIAQSLGVIAASTLQEFADAVGTDQHPARRHDTRPLAISRTDS